MIPMVSRSRALALAACLTLITAPRVMAQQWPEQQGVPASVSAKMLCDQLGATLQPRNEDELRLGVSVTAVLQEPDKLAEFGVKGMHAGARVIVARVAPDKVRVEADEMNPNLVSAGATLKLDARGAMVPPGKS